MTKRILRLAALGFGLFVALGAVAPRNAEALAFCIEQCNNHLLQECCGECRLPLPCHLICHPSTTPC